MAKKAASRTNPALARKRQAAEVVVKEAPTQQAIAARAFELYQMRGALDGDALDDWLRAETELSANQI